MYDCAVISCQCNRSCMSPYVHICVLFCRVQIFRKGLTRMFSDRGEDCVFMETCMNLKRYPHMVIECIPLPKEIGDVAPIYFKVTVFCCNLLIIWLSCTVSSLISMVQVYNNYCYFSLILTK